MHLAELLIGFILIVCGILVKVNPNLIAGYNSPTENKKDHIDIIKLSTMMRNYLIVTGVIAIIALVLLYFFEVRQSIRLICISAVVVFGIIIMIIKGQSYA